jgi:hypothetical protein
LRKGLLEEYAGDCVKNTISVDALGLHSPINILKITFMQAPE